MKGILARYRGLLMGVVLLGLPVLFLYANARDPGTGGRLGEAVHWVTAPVQSAVSRTWQGLDNRLKRYFWLVGVAQDNHRLRHRVRTLRLQLRDAEEQRRENQRLQRLLHLDRELPGVRTVTARVIAVGESPSYRSFRIDRGRADGVQRRAGVITVEGVVGRVVRASRYWSDVLLLVDAGSRLDVLVARSRARGMLRGAGQTCRIEAMDRTVDIEIGDELLTSGFDGVFPKGVPVGRVTEISRPKMGLYLDARVQAFAPVARLEEVQVLIDAPQDLDWPRLQGSAPAVPLDPAGAAAPDDEATQLQPATTRARPAGAAATGSTTHTGPGHSATGAQHPRSAAVTRAAVTETRHHRARPQATLPSDAPRPTPSPTPTHRHRRTPRPSAQRVMGSPGSASPTRPHPAAPAGRGDASAQP